MISRRGFLSGLGCLLPVLGPWRPLTRQLWSGWEPDDVDWQFSYSTPMSAFEDFVRDTQPVYITGMADLEKEGGVHVYYFDRFLSDGIKLTRG